MKQTESKGQIFFRLCAWAGIAFVLLMFLGIFARFFARTVLVGLLGVPKENRIVSVLLKNRMKNDFEEEITAPKTLGEIGSVASLLTGRAERAVGDDTLGRSLITRAVNRGEALLGMQLGVFDGETMYDLDGYLVWASAEKPEDATASSSANLLRFADYFLSRGLPMLYVMIPPRVCAQTDWVSGTVDFSVENHGTKAAWLEKNGIETLDLLTPIHAEGRDHHALFFRTDHHWRPAAGLWAAEELADALTGRFGLAADVSVFDADCYRIETHQKSFLGSLGKKITQEKVVPDDLDIYSPVFETDLTVSFIDKPEERGDFSLLYDMDYFDLSTPLSDQDPYSIYLRGNCGHVTIENNLADNATRLLIIGDSFDNVLVPFLSLSVRYVDVFDLRGGEYGRKLWQLIENKDYDCAIVMTDSLRYAFE